MGVVGDIEVVLCRSACLVGVVGCEEGVVGVVFRAVERGCWWMYKWMHGKAGAKRVEVEDVEDFMFVHEGLGVGVSPFTSLLYSGGNTAEETNDLFVGT